MPDDVRYGEERVYHMKNLQPDDTIHYRDCHPMLLEQTRRPVNTKQDFYRRFYAGEFGNHGLMWATFSDWRMSGYCGRVAIRSKVKGGPCVYNIEPFAVDAITQHFRRCGFNDEHLNWSAMAPTEKTRIQGEVMLSHRGMDLCYSRATLPMREALSKSPAHACGLTALSILRANLCPSSFSWLEQLLDNYPGHVVEFSTFSVPWGVVPGMNTVFWEVRNY